MNPVLAAASAILRGRDRATSVLTVIAFALPHAVFLAVLGGVGAFQARASRFDAAYSEQMGQGGGTMYTALAYFAATLLIVPILSMGAAAARLGMSRRAHDLAVLRLIGLGPGAAKLACVVETAAHAGAGVVVGSVLYAVTLPAWGLIAFQGWPMAASEMWVGVLLLLGAALAIVVLAALSAWFGMRKVAITPLGVTRRQKADRVTPIGVVVGAVLLVVWLTAGSKLMNAGFAIGMAALFGFLAAIFLIVNLIGVWSVSLLGRLIAAVARRPQTVLAGRRLVDDPRSLWRSFGPVALVGFLVGVLYPILSVVGGMAGDDPVSRMVGDDMLRGMILTFCIALVLGAISTAVNQAIRAIDSAEQARALFRMGSPLAFMDRARRIEIGVPALLMIPGSMLIGFLFIIPIASGAGLWGTLGALLATAVGGVALILAASELSAPLRRAILEEARESNE